MTEMKWTKDTPTIPGWYWLMIKRDNYTTLEIIEFSLEKWCKTKKPVIYWNGRDESVISMDSFLNEYTNVLWQGPLEVPEPPNEE